MRMTNLTLMGCAMAMGLSGIASAASALEATTSAIVRTAPSSTAASIGTAPVGQGYVGVGKTANGWWKVWYNGQAGYAAGGSWKILSGLSGVKVTATSLSVRKGPGTSYAIVGKVYEKQIYRYASVSGSWYKIWWGGGVYYIPASGVNKVALNSYHLDMVCFRQNWLRTHAYYCGPVTTQTIVNFLTGRTIDPYVIGAFEGTTTSGTSTAAVVRGINYFGKTNYFVAHTFNRTRAVLNLNRNTPVHINFKTRYMAYTGGSNFKHHSPIKGYTSGGFYIHDTAWGPNRWASTTEVTNAVNYHAGLYSVRF